jgi:hypothetical protein
VAVPEPHPRSDAFRVSQSFAAQCQQLSKLVAQASNGQETR